MVESTFNEYCKRCGLLDDFDPFILSFFHELGHYETFDIVEDDEYENDYFCKVALDMKETRSREDYFAYYEYGVDCYGLGGQVYSTSYRRCSHS